MRSPSASTRMAETGERRPATRRAKRVSTPSAARSATIWSPVRSSASRVASQHRPPSRAIATEALPAQPPPTTARSRERYFSPRVGMVSTL